MNIPLLILGMALVTYLPRLIPSLIINKVSFGKRFERFIGLIPYTAMAALIVPGIFSADPERWYIGVIGGVVAITLACFKKIPSTVAVLGSVLAVMLVYCFV